MRKKSHILLSNFLLKQYGAKDIIRYELAFKVGSVIPDIVPTFFTKKHEIATTFDVLEKKINQVIDSYDSQKGFSISNSKDLGVITHYIADYFTFPHNEQYTGSLKDHCMYEKELKFLLRDYTEYLDGEYRSFSIENRSNAEDICAYIKAKHQQYLEGEHDLKKDCESIVGICENVIGYIFVAMLEKSLYYQFA